MNLNKQSGNDIKTLKSDIIEQAKANGFYVDDLLNPDLSIKQMHQIIEGVERKVDVSAFSDPELSVGQMQAIKSLLMFELMPVDEVKEFAKSGLDEAEMWKEVKRLETSGGAELQVFEIGRLDYEDGERATQIFGKIIDEVKDSITVFGDKGVSLSLQSEQLDESYQSNIQMTGSVSRKLNGELYSVSTLGMTIYEREETNTLSEIYVTKFTDGRPDKISLSVYKEFSDIGKKEGTILEDLPSVAYAITASKMVDRGNNGELVNYANSRHITIDEKLFNPYIQLSFEDRYKDAEGKHILRDLDRISDLNDLSGTIYDTPIYHEILRDVEDYKGYLRSNINALENIFTENGVVSETTYEKGNETEKKLYDTFKEYYERDKTLVLDFKERISAKNAQVEKFLEFGLTDEEVKEITEQHYIEGRTGDLTETLEEKRAEKEATLKQELKSLEEKFSLERRGNLFDIYDNRKAPDARVEIQRNRFTEIIPFDKIENPKIKEQVEKIGLEMINDFKNGVSKFGPDVVKVISDKDPIDNKFDINVSYSNFNAIITNGKLEKVSTNSMTLSHADTNVDAAHNIRMTRNVLDGKDSFDVSTYKIMDDTGRKESVTCITDSAEKAIILTEMMNEGKNGEALAFTEFKFDISEIDREYFKPDIQLDSNNKASELVVLERYIDRMEALKDLSDTKYDTDGYKELLTEGASYLAEMKLIAHTLKYIMVNKGAVDISEASEVEKLVIDKFLDLKNEDEDEGVELKEQIAAKELEIKEFEEKGLSLKKQTEISEKVRSGEIRTTYKEAIESATKNHKTTLENELKNLKKEAEDNIYYIYTELSQEDKPDIRFEKKTDKKIGERFAFIKYKDVEKFSAGIVFEKDGKEYFTTTSKNVKKDTFETDERGIFIFENKDIEGIRQNPKKILENVYEKLGFGDKENEGVKEAMANIADAFRKYYSKSGSFTRKSDAEKVETLISFATMAGLFPETQEGPENVGGSTRSYGGVLPDRMNVKTFDKIWTIGHVGERAYTIRIFALPVFVFAGFLRLLKPMFLEATDPEGNKVAARVRVPIRMLLKYFPNYRVSAKYSRGRIDREFSDLELNTIKLALINASGRKEVFNEKTGKYEKAMPDKIVLLDKEDLKQLRSEVSVDQSVEKPIEKHLDTEEAKIETDKNDNLEKEVDKKTDVDAEKQDIGVEKTDVEKEKVDKKEENTKPDNVDKKLESSKEDKTEKKDKSEKLSPEVKKGLEKQGATKDEISKLEKELSPESRERLNESVENMSLENQREKVEASMPTANVEKEDSKIVAKHDNGLKVVFESPYNTKAKLEYVSSGDLKIEGSASRVLYRKGENTIESNRTLYSNSPIERLDKNIKYIFVEGNKIDIEQNGNLNELDLRNAADNISEIKGGDVNSIKDSIAEGFEEFKSAIDESKTYEKEAVEMLKNIDPRVETMLDRKLETEARNSEIVIGALAKYFEGLIDALELDAEEQSELPQDEIEAIEQEQEADLEDQYDYDEEMEFPDDGFDLSYDEDNFSN